MPTYEYECEKCSKRFEKFQSMTEPALKACPDCKGKVRRLIGTGAGLIFKGSGFYETDYKRKPAGKVKDVMCEKPACKTTNKCQSES